LSYRGTLNRALKTRKLRFQIICSHWSLPVNCGHLAANQSVGRAAEFENIGRNEVVASKSARPTVLVAMALQCYCIALFLLGYYRCLDH